jgi:hypothetical protein
LRRPQWRFLFDPEGEVKSKRSSTLLAPSREASISCVAQSARELWKRRTPEQRRQTAKATLANPPLSVRSQHCGAGWRETCRALSPHEQSRIAAKIALGQARYHARRRGEPLPYTFEPQPAPGGGATAKPGTMREMTRRKSFLFRDVCAHADPSVRIASAALSSAILSL